MPYTIFKRDEKGLVKITPEEIQQHINEGKVGFLSFDEGYIIGDTYCMASALTLYPNETKIFDRDGELIVTANFRQYKLPREFRDGNDDQLVTVECNLKENKNFFVSIHEA